MVYRTCFMHRIMFWLNVSMTLFYGLSGLTKFDLFYTVGIVVHIALAYSWWHDLKKANHNEWFDRDFFMNYAVVKKRRWAIKELEKPLRDAVENQNVDHERISLLMRYISFLERKIPEKFRS